MPIAARYPLIQYLKVQQQSTQLIRGILMDSSKEIEKRLIDIAGKDNISSQVDRAMLKAQKAAIDAQLAVDWSKIETAIKQGRLEAAAAASKVVSEYENTLLSGFVDRAFLRDLSNGLAERSAAGIDSLMARIGGSSRTLSQTVYKTSVLAGGQIDAAINRALVQSLSAKDFARSIRNLIDPNVPGGVSYAAMRTARTEQQNAFHAAANKRYKDSAIVEAVDWHLSSSHPEGDICDKLASDGPYDVEEVPEKPHPQCFCFTTPALPDREQFIDNLFAGKYGDEPWVEETNLGAFDDDSGALDGDKLDWGRQHVNMPKAKTLNNDLEQDAIRQYSGSEYTEMNSILRKDVSKFKWNADHNIWMSEDGKDIYKDGVMQRAQMLQDVLRRTKTSEALNLYRSNGYRTILQNAGLDSKDISQVKNLVGTTLDNKAFTSASFLSKETQIDATRKLTSTGLTEEQAIAELAKGGREVTFPWNSNNAVQLRITVPKGTHGADITDYSRYKQDEAEFLFAPNTRMRVTGYHFDEKTNKHWLDVIIEDMGPVKFPKK